jgi:hypothetical protein
MLFSTRIAQLGASLTEMTTDRDRLAGIVAELQSANDLFKQADTDQLAQIGTLTAERDQLTTSNTDLTTRVATLEGSIDTQVRERLAGAGVPVVELVDKQNPGDPKAENPAGLSPKQRLAASFNAKFDKK